ncbi:GPI mannosyltransferase 4 [Candida albicans SC5314]|nr:GPI mannosyltransferase 4 [Candida albicans SC5314]KHC88524.1 GPI mannosyltransferase 4 [Candida albicans SC5314]
MIKINFNWRTFYLLTIVFRFVFTLSDSYIHPDEHFQSLEVLTNRILNYSTNIPWEFQDDPARSLAPLYFIYGPLLYFIKFFKLNLTALQIWYIARLQISILSWIITDFCLYWMLPSKPERIKAIFFTSTSYITLVYQNHLFSNSIETLLLLVTILLIDDLRYVQESKDQDVQNLNKNKNLFYTGVLISLGIFNRITFPAFLILPGWFVMKYVLKHYVSGLYLVMGFFSTTALLILVDTILFGNINNVVAEAFNISSYIIAPLNNLLYNAKYENLAQHGIHPYYTHILVNMPQILGPGLIFFVSKSYTKTTPFLTVISGLLFLSVIPHQELRFLIPLLPLACCSFDFTLKWVQPWMLYTWYIFNIFMSILMGKLHQGGVVPVLDHIKSEASVQVWWRTYTPPSWILGSNSTETTHLGEKLNDNIFINIVDCMGADSKEVQQILQTISTNKPVYLITPIASFKHFDESRFSPVWNYTFHLDLDHLDFADIQPGLGVYQLL